MAGLGAILIIGCIVLPLVAAIRVFKYAGFRGKLDRDFQKNVFLKNIFPAIIFFIIATAIFSQGGPEVDEQKEKSTSLTKKEKKERIQDDIKSIGGDYIKEVDVYPFQDKGYSANIFYLKDSALTASTYVFAAGTDIKNISKQAVNRWPEKISRFVFFIQAPTQDEYGNQGSSLAMKLYYNASELKKVNWDNFTNWDMLNLVGDLEVKPLGKSMISKYCQDSSNAENSRSFCLKALR